MTKSDVCVIFKKIHLAKNDNRQDAKALNANYGIIFIFAKRTQRRLQLKTYHFLRENSFKNECKTFLCGRNFERTFCIKFAFATM